MIDSQEIGTLVADPVRQTAARGQALADAVKILLQLQRDHPGAGLRRDNPGRTAPARADFQHARRGVDAQLSDAVTHAVCTVVVELVKGADRLDGER